MSIQRWTCAEGDDGAEAEATVKELFAPKPKTPEDTNLAHKTIYFTGFAYDPRNQEESWPVTAAIDIKELISALKEAARGE
jgi:hypothetical protein